MSIWYIILVTVMANGEASVDVRYPLNPKYNNEADCNQVGDTFMREEQMKLGTSQGTVYFICKVMTPEDQRKATSTGDGA